MTNVEGTEAPEGRRARKARETRERIANAAITLFLERGFDATTVDDIARDADVSKRSFFDYFPAKEDVIAAWQDEFAVTLAEAVASRPRTESLANVVEEALIEAIRTSIDPRAIAIDELVRATPALRARDQLKYMNLEKVLADGLANRVDSDAGRHRARLLAAIAIAWMRVAAEEWQERRRTDDAAAAKTPTRAAFRSLWAMLGELGAGRPGRRSGRTAR